ncbi:MAG: O-antigen ligase family protein [Vicinamibacterales bacterium]
MTTGALWIPIIWTALAASKMASQWLGMAPHTVSAAQALDGNPLDRNVQLMLVLLGVGILVYRRERTLPVLRANLPILLFFCYGAASVVWSDFPFVAFKRWTKAVGDLVMVLVIVTEMDGTAAVKRFLARIGYLLVPLSILLIKYYPRIGTSNRVANGSQVFLGVTSDKNMLGVVCLVFGLAAAWRIFHIVRSDARRSWGRPLIVQGVILLMVFWLFRRANSMTSLACFVIGAGLIVATSFRWFARRPALVHVVVATALAGAALPLFLDAGGAVLSAVGRDPTLTGRTELWGEVIELSGNPLIGVGWESFWLGSRLETLWARHWWRPNEAHNGYLEVFLNLGWTGIFLLAFVAVRGYAGALGDLRRDPQLGGLRLAFVIVGLTYGLSEAAFRMLHPIWIMFLLGVVALPEMRPAGEIEATRDATEPPGVPHVRSFDHWKGPQRRLADGSPRGTHSRSARRSVVP